MCEGWDGGARRNWRRSVWAEASDSEESFRASGERDYKRYVGKFLSDLQIDPAERVALEIGCGVGRMSEFLARDFCRLVALDISREMLKIGRQRVTAKNILWLCNDGMSLGPVADHSVDFIFSLSVIQHIPDAATIVNYVEEAGRVLKPGGWFIFQMMNQPHLSVGPWTVSLFISRRFHIPRIRIYRLNVLDADPTRMGIVRRGCNNSGLIIVRILHRFNQNAWIWAQKKG
jgi:SAM-dependent methyltransferase